MENPTAELESTDTGQPVEGPAEPTTPTGPGADASEQSAAGDDTQTTDSGPADSSDAEDTFFDPQTIKGKPELEAAYKQMQGAFTKKMQEISSKRDALSMVDQFNQDPIGTMQQLAQRMGYKLTPAQAAEAAKQQQQEFQPESWDQVLSEAQKRAEEAILGKLQPLLQQVQQQRRSVIESQLMEIDPTWQQYEGEMKRLLSEIPGLAQDPAKLYRLAVPDHVLEQRATQKALAKLESKARAAKMGGSSSTSKTPKPAAPTGPMSFQDAVRLAQQQLAEQGLRPGIT